MTRNLYVAHFGSVMFCLSSPRCIKLMDTGRHTAGGNPVMDWHPIQGGLTILLGMLLAKETRISSGCLGLWPVCAFNLPFYLCQFYFIFHQSSNLAANQ